jgi:hypothetical protein
MKKNAALFCVLIAAAVFGNAQAVDRSRYEEITLPQFDAWKQGLTREGTEPALFKARVLFEGILGTVISFIDPGTHTPIEFTVDKTWPEMEEGQQVTIYFTASGSWSWERVLDEIDRGPALAYDQGQYDQDSYDQAGYGEEPEFDESEDWDQDGVPAGTETGPSPVPEASPPAPRPVSRGSALSIKITGPAPRPGKVYRLQVGAFKVEGNAVRAFNRLQEAGFSPNYERCGQYLRVVLSGVRAAEVKGYTERIDRAGFNEIWYREER